MTIVGTRPEIIRLSRVIALLEEHTDHVLVHTGQNYDHELYSIFMEELGLESPKHQLDAAVGSPMETIANILSRIDPVLEDESPDAVLVLGDTNSALSVLAAKRRKIPIFHMESGNRCFDARVPEETNRRIVDHISDINLCYTEHARRYLLAEGFPSDRIMVTGSPMHEVLSHYAGQIESSNVLDRLALEKGKYFVASLHREENVDSPARLRLLGECLDAIAEKYGLPILFSVHPRTRKRLESLGIQLDDRIVLSKPLGLFDYVALQKNAACTLSDSGTITEESSILGFPAVTVRESHERPEGMDEGVLIMTGLQPDRVLESISVTLAQRASGVLSGVPADYDSPACSWKVLKLILSYTEYVRRRVWQVAT